MARSSKPNPVLQPMPAGVRRARAAASADASPRAENAPGNDVAAIVLRQFRQVFNAVKTHFQQVEKKVGLGGAQVWALSVIRDRPGIGVSELARALDIHQSTASNLVRGLAERELILITRSNTDRRSVHVKLLPAAQRVLKKSPLPFSGVLPDALRRLDANSLRRLNKDLDRLLVELGGSERAGKVPIAGM
ncbi:MAG TPA: MarR family transcriptional regulator [Burkholderiaceae bacterium]|nr:MarR family transcriptional regulator [Burkholderiaceae bacterium]